MLFEVNISINSYMMDYCITSFDMLGEYHILKSDFHKSIP